MEKFSINGDMVCLFAKQRGSNTNKFNRASKIAAMYEELESKLRGMIERAQPASHHSRVALATLLLMKTGMRVGNEESAEGYMTKPHPKIGRAHV